MIHQEMKMKTKLSKTNREILSVIRRDQRLEEIALHGKLISMRTVKQQSKKVYKRNRRVKLDDF